MSPYVLAAELRLPVREASAEVLVVPVVVNDVAVDGPEVGNGFP